MGETYRETALEQAVLSHGTIEIPMSAPHSNYHAPNDPKEVVKAAVAYERFLTRDARQAEAMADKLAEALRLTQERLGPELLPEQIGWAWFDALEEYKLWKAELGEPF